MTPRTRRLLPQLSGGAAPALGDLGPLEPVALWFSVPGPPVPWERVAGGHVPPRTRAYKKHVGLCALAARTRHDRGLVPAAGWPIGAAEYAVTLDVYRVPTKGRQRKGDADNYAKSCADSLSGILYADDSAITDLHVRIHPCEAGRERAEVRVEVLRRKERA